MLFLADGFVTSLTLMQILQKLSAPSSSSLVYWSSKRTMLNLQISPTRLVEWELLLLQICWRRKFWNSSWQFSHRYQMKDIISFTNSFSGTSFIRFIKGSRLSYREITLSSTIPSSCYMLLIKYGDVMRIFLRYLNRFYEKSP